MLWYMADGWWPAFYCSTYALCAPSAPTLPDQLNSNAWVNVFAARTHAIACLLQTPERVIDVLR
jgi:hypothetical protein